MRLAAKKNPTTKKLDLEKDLFLRSQLLQIWEDSAGLSFGGTAWPTITGKGKGLSQNWQFFESTGDNF